MMIMNVIILILRLNLIITILNLLILKFFIEDDIQMELESLKNVILNIYNILIKIKYTYL